MLWVWLSEESHPRNPGRKINPWCPWQQAGAQSTLMRLFLTSPTPHPFMNPTCSWATYLYRLNNKNLWRLCPFKVKWHWRSELRRCMHRRVFIKKTWLSAFSYAQSCISLVFCSSIGFLVPWSSSLTSESDLAYFLCYVWRRRWVDFNWLFAETITYWHVWMSSLLYSTLIIFKL